jgi:tetratricopeptide (TPR) repeat protein
MSLDPGATLSHYRVVEQIGAGGMGVVYRAEDTRLKRDVALKILSEGSLADPAARRRFRKEALALSRLSHPNIATVFDFDSEGGTDFLVMEHIPGRSLDEILAEGVLPEKELLSLGAQLVEGIAAAHERGLIHRDLKPGNLRVTPDGRLKILDFGLAKLLATSETATTETLRGSVVGTLPYMAPEQLQGEAVDWRADLYACGAVLYQMSTGKQPFAGFHGGELAAAILGRAPRPPSEVDPRVTPALENVILKALDKDPARRYQSAREIGVDLERATTPVSLPSAPMAAASASRRRRLLLWSLAPVLLLAAAAVVVLVSGVWSRPALSFDARDWILVADFENETGDPLFDTSLLTAFTVSLEQSAHANVLPRSRAREALERMGQPESERIDAETGREICLREDVRGLVAPAIGRVGQEYALSARLVDPRTGDTVRSYMEPARDQDRILDALGAIASGIRRDLGESLASIERSDEPLPRVTTPSLPALKAYADAEQLWAKGQYDEAVRLWENALDHDPDFAAAHASLGSAYFSHVYNLVALGEKHVLRALELSERTTERERLYIQAAYAGHRGRHEEAAQRYRALLEAYPDVYGVRYNLGNYLRAMGHLDEAVSEYEEVLRLDPSHAGAHINLASCFVYLGRFPEALEHYRLAFELRPDWLTIGNLNHEYGMSLLAAGEKERAREIFRLAVEDPEARSDGLRSMAFLDLNEGRYRSARRGFEEALVAHEAERMEISVARVHVLLALVLDAQGDREGALGHLSEAAAVDPEKFPLWIVARPGFFFARFGVVEQAEAVLERIRPKADPGSHQQSALLHRLEGEIELARGRNDRAIELLQLARSEHGDPLTFESLLRAHSMAGDNAEVIELYEALPPTGPGVILGWEPQLLWPELTLRLAEAYRDEGRPGEARSILDTFLESWRHADLELPVRDALIRLRESLNEARGAAGATP